MTKDILPDVLRPGLKVVFCGTAAGRASAEAECYYAHSNNKFWSVLADVGLTSRKLKPHEFKELVNFGIGLTDLCKDAAGSDREIRPMAKHRVVLRQKIEEALPIYLAFTSLEAGKRFYGRRVSLGLQTERIRNTSIFVLPSTSPMAAWNWEANKSCWYEFAQLVR